MPNGFTHRRAGDIEYLTIPQFEAAGGVKHCFSTRRGGVSTGGCESLNLGFNRGESEQTVLENYGYDVLDLGRDVPPETVVDAVVKENIRLVGLSALMTTTLPSMEETVHQLHALPNPPSIMVGGAVVTPEYAQNMGAFYAKDARASVEIAKKILG